MFFASNAVVASCGAAFTPPHRISHRQNGAHWSRRGDRGIRSKIGRLFLVCFSSLGTSESIRMFGKWAKRRDLGSCHWLVMQQVLLGCLQKGHGVLLSRTLVENPASSPSRMGSSKSQSPHAVSNWENSLGKVKLFLLRFIRTLRASSQEFWLSPRESRGTLRGWVSGLLLAAEFVRHVQMMDFVGDLLLSGSVTVRHQAQASWSHWSPREAAQGRIFRRFQSP